MCRGESSWEGEFTGRERGGEHRVPRSAQPLLPQAWIALAHVGVPQGPCPPTILGRPAPRPTLPSRHSGTLKEALLPADKQERVLRQARLPSSLPAPSSDTWTVLSSWPSSSPAPPSSRSPSPPGGSYLPGGSGASDKLLTLRGSLCSSGSRLGTSGVLRVPGAQP